MTVTRVTEAGKHSVTVPAHRELRVGTLNAIVSEVAEVVGLSRRAVREALFRVTERPTPRVRCCQLAWYRAGWCVR